MVAGNYLHTKTICLIKGVLVMLGLGGLFLKGLGGPALPPLIFVTMKTSMFSTNGHPRFTSIVLDCVLRPPCLARTTPKVYLYLRKQCARRRQGSYWQGMKEINISPTRDSLICHPSKSVFFTYLAPLMFDCLRPPLFISPPPIFDCLQPPTNGFISYHS